MPAVGGWRSSASSPRATSEATTPATTVRDSPVSSSSFSRVSVAELAKVARTMRSTSATDDPWLRCTADTRPPPTIDFNERATHKILLAGFTRESTFDLRLSSDES